MGSEWCSGVWALEAWSRGLRIVGQPGLVYRRNHVYLYNTKKPSSIWMLAVIFEAASESQKFLIYQTS